MSVTTDADEKLENTRDHFAQAIDYLAGVINPSTWGHSSYDDEFMDSLVDIYAELIKLNRKLNK